MEKINTGSFSPETSGDTSLNCLPYLTNQLTEIYFSNTSITCLPNFIPSAIYSPPIGTYPFCNTYIHTCPSYTAIQGNIFMDTDLDCIIDSTEPKINYINLNLKQGITTTQNTTSGFNGLYSFDPLSNGIYTVNIDTTNIPFTV